jgi:hypothetical protein
MKKATTDAKKAAANDKENGNGKATKRVSACSRLSLGNSADVSDTMKRFAARAFPCQRQKATGNKRSLVQTHNRL